MAQWNSGNTSYQGNGKTLFEVNMLATRDGIEVKDSNPLPVKVTSGSITADLGSAARSAFGELLSVSPTPIVQLDALYGVDLQDVTILNTGAGSSAGTDAGKSVFQVQTGTTSTGDAHLLSKKYMKYRPGQGSLSRFTAAFTTGVANSTQRAGLMDSEVALCVGYNGVDFGVLRSTGGKVSINKLTITVAPTGAQTATVVLDGVSKAVAIIAGTTIQTATTIALASYPGWYTEQIDNTVIFRAIDPAVAAGAFTFSSAGAGTLAVGAFASIQTGVAQNDIWVNRTNFNIDTLDGTGNAANPSGMLIDPTKLNVFQISFRWLGAGVINYAIEDQITGEIITFHQQHYTNQHRVPHLDNPSFRIGYSVTNLGNTTNLTVIGASMLMAIEGIVNLTRSAKSRSQDRTSLTKDDVHHIFSIRNSYTYANKINTASINLKKMSFGFQSTDPVTIYAFQDASSPSTPLTFTNVLNSITTFSNTAATFNLGIDNPAAVFVVGVNGFDNIDVASLLISEPPGSIISFAVTSPAAIARATVAAMWAED
jgi:hypothetical protein